MDMPLNGEEFSVSFCCSIERITGSLYGACVMKTRVTSQQAVAQILLLYLIYFKLLYFIIILLIL